MKENDFIKNRFLLFLIFIFLLIPANITSVLAAGGIRDETDVAQNTAMDNNRITYKSDYSKTGEGYELVEFIIPTEKGPVTQQLKYYHYVRVRIDQEGKIRTIPLWLYKWTNQIFDKEIEEELKTSRASGTSMLGFYDPTGNSSVHVPDESLGATFMNYFMWPMSSEKRGL